MMELEWKVVQVTNVSPTVTKEQMLHFFEYVGRVKDLKLYPETDDPTSVPVATKVCYVRYESGECAKVALHLGNTVFVDRALIVVPYPDLNIPDEMKAMRVAAPASAVAGILPPTLQWPPQVVNMICGTGPHQTIQTIDSKLIEHGLPVYPPLPGNTEPSKIEEIRRTVYASNLDSAVNTDQLVQFFSQAGEVKYVRMAGDENMPSRNAYIEFTSQKSIPMALGYSGVMLNGRPLKVTHSLSVIANKPQTKNEEALAKEIDEAMKKVKESQHVMAAAAEGADAKRRSRSTSKTRKRRSRTRSKERRRSRERERRRSRSRDRYRRSRSRDRSRERERERERSREKRKRSRTPPRGHRTARRSRSGSREKRRRSKSRDRKETSSKTRGSSIPKRSDTPVKPPDEGPKVREDKSSDVKYSKSTTSDADVIRNGEGESTQDSTREVEEMKTDVSNGGPAASAVSGAEGDSASAKEVIEADSKPIDVEVKQRKSRSKSPAKKERSRIDARLEKYADYSSSKKRRSKSPARKADERSSRRSTSRSRTRRSSSKTRSKRSRSRSRKRSTSKSRARRSTSKSRTRRSTSRSHRKRSVSKTRSSRKSRSRSRQRRDRSRSKEKRSRSKEKRRRSRSQSGDKRSKRKKDRSRSRDRGTKVDRTSLRRSSTDRQTTKDQKRQSKEKESSTSDDKKEVKVKRDYDEEEKGFDSGADKVENVDTKPPLDSLVKAEPVEQSEDGRSEDMVTDDKSEDMVMDDKSEDAANAEDSRSSFVSSNAAGEDSQQ